MTRRRFWGVRVDPLHTLRQALAAEYQRTGVRPSAQFARSMAPQIAAIEAPVLIEEIEQHLRRQS